MFSYVGVSIATIEIGRDQGAEIRVRAMVVGVYDKGIILPFRIIGQVGEGTVSSGKIS